MASKRNRSHHYDILDQRDNFSDSSRIKCVTDTHRGDHASQKTRHEKSSRCHSHSSRKDTDSNRDLDKHGYREIDRGDGKKEHQSCEKLPAADKDADGVDNCDIDWKGYRRLLDSIFFRDEDTIKRSSQEYDDFWAFLDKYQAFQRKRLLQDSEVKPAKMQQLTDDKFGLPKHYDKRYRINVSLMNKDVSKLVHDRGHGRGAKDLTANQLSYFMGVLLHYIDFLQKQKFNKLTKIKKDQQNLPIYEHRDEIIEAVANNQVIVVAGDTGCGKSTQVPQYLLSAGYTQIACTQPRRIACISLSRRVSYETLNEYGSEVAYQVCECAIGSLEFCLPYSWTIKW